MKSWIAIAAALLLAPLVQAQGLKGEYYSNLGLYPRLPDQPQLTRVDADVAFSDDPARPAAPFALPRSIVRNLNTARWTGSFDAVAGTHRFTVETHNAAVLAVDGAIVVDLRNNFAYARAEGEVTLAAGPHFVELFYGRSGSLGLIRMSVTRLPGTPVPLSTFSPSPTYPASYRATSRTLDFETPVAGGPYVVDQYAASAGVRFIPITASQGYPSRPMLRGIAAGRTSSGTGVLFNDSRDPIELTTASANVPLRIRFDRPLLRVSLTAGAPWPDRASRTATAILRAFDASGRLLGADVARLTPDVTTRLEVARGAADIASISLDYGGDDAGETIDDLRVETMADAPRACTPALPEVEFVRPTPGQEVFAGTGEVSATFLVREPCGTLASTALLSGLRRGTVAPSTHPGCDAPACFAFEGTIRMPPGEAFLRATATNSDGTFSNAVVRVRVRGARIHVTRDGGGGPVAGAEVYVSGERVTGVAGDLTDLAGNMELTTPLRRGASIAARVLLFQSPAPRRAHERGSISSGTHWNYRAYNTSTSAGPDGRFVQVTVGDPNAVHEVVISSTKTLIGLHVVASIEWDASNDDLVFFRDQKLLPASRYLFNATDGQMYFERIDIFDNAANWDHTDFRIYADNTVGPHVNARTGGFLGGGLPTHMHMRGLPAAAGVSDSGFSDFQVYAHEFGHYGLGLYDEYQGWADAHCTDLGRVAGSGPFHANQPRASCMMWNQWTASKMCSSHPENPHTWVNLQGTLNRTDCWSSIVHNYGRHEGARERRAFDPIILTPATRGAIVGPIADLPVRAWAPVVDLVNAAPTPGLCGPITIVARDSGGMPVSNRGISFLTPSGRIHAGRTGTDGSIMLRGLHVGDTVDVDPPFVITPAGCTPTM